MDICTSHPQENASQLCQHKLEMTENSNDWDSKSSYIYSTEFYSSRDYRRSNSTESQHAQVKKDTPNTTYAIIRFC